MADLLKAELMARANETILEFEKRGLKAAAFFKATCPYCGNRVTFNEPNICYDSMECAGCGLIFPFIRGGYLVQVNMGAKT